MNPPVLVLGTHLTALGVFRTLAKRPVRAYGLEATSDMVTRSRWYRPAPRQLRDTADSSVLETFLLSLDFPKAVLMPCNDNWARAAAGLSEVARARFPVSLPTRDVVEAFTDKRRFRALVERLGISTPRAWDLPSIAALDDVPQDQIHGSFLKPIDSTRFNRRFGSKGWFPRSVAEARALMERGTAVGVEFILQEWIPGGASNAVFIDGFVDRGGRIVSMSARRQLRMDPPRLANTSCGVTIRLSEVQQAAEITRRLIEESGYRGVFNVEFKHDPRDGQFKIIEMNARPFWYIAHVARAGIDLPWMSYLDAQELPVPEPGRYDIGRYGVYETLDGMAVLRALRAGRRPHGPVFRPWLFGDRAGIWWNDPLPGLIDAGAAVRGRLMRGLQGRVSNRESTEEHPTLAIDEREESSVRRISLMPRFVVPGRMMSRRVARPPGQSPAVIRELDRAEDPPVLVLGTHLTALGVFRTLARRRIPAYGIQTSRDIETRSRWYRPAERQIPETTDSAVLEAYLESLGFPRAVLIPCNDNWIMAAAGLSAAARSRFPVSLPSRAVVENFTDKKRFRELVEGLGIPTPRTRDVPTAGSIDAVPEAELRGSFLKPIDSPRFNRRFGSKGWFPESRSRARELVELGATAGVEFVLQEWIPGDFSRSVLVDGFVDRHGRIVSMTARRRLRMDPPHLANTSCSVTIPLSEIQPAAEMTRRMLEQTGYRGVFNVEFKHDPRDGQFKIIEMNARPFWLVAHVASAGVDLPWMCYLDAQDRPVPEPSHFDVGRYGVYEPMDVAAVIRALRSGHRPNGPVLRPWLQGDRATFWWKDPLPGVFEGWKALRGRIEKSVRRPTRRAPR